MVKIRKLRREVRRILHKSPIVGKYIPFPKPNSRPFIENKVSSANERLDSISQIVESQLFALSGLKSCTAQQQTSIVQYRQKLNSLDGQVSVQESCIQSHNAILRRLESELATLTSLTGKLTQVEAEQHQIRDRMEFSRQESMLEIQRLRKVLAVGEATTTVVTETAIKNVDLVTSQLASGCLKLNLGCGHKPLDGYVNVDSRDLPGIDVVSRIDAMPFEKGQVAEIHSSHLLEHFMQVNLVNDLLPYWFELLRPGGKFIAVVPDGSAMMRSYAAGGMTFEDIRLVTYGGQEYEGNFHYTMFNSSSLASLLDQAGFTDIVVVDEGRRNGLCLELEISARKPA